RDALGRGCPRARGALQLSLAHGAGASRGGSRTRGVPSLQRAVVRELPIPPAESPAWHTLAAAGSSGGADDDFVADLLHLDASDRRVLAPLAPLAAGAADSF